MMTTRIARYVTWGVIIMGLLAPGVRGQHHGDDCDEHHPPAPILSVADVTGDGVVDSADVVAVAHRNAARRGDPRYHPLYDLDADGGINGRDVSKAARDIGRPVPLVDTQLARVALATMRYSGPDGLANALADGYLPFTPEFKGHGVHYARYDRIYAPFDIERPIGLNFSADGELLAVFYVRFVAWQLDEPFPYSLLPDPADDFPPMPSFDGLMEEDWHAHEFVWWTGIGSLDWRDVTFEQDLTLEEVAARVVAVGGRLFPEDLASDQAYAAKFWMLHAWVHTLNPCGVFAGTDPTVAPDAPDEHSGGGSHH